MGYKKKGIHEPLTEKEIVETFGDSEDELDALSDSDTEIEINLLDLETRELVNDTVDIQQEDEENQPISIQSIETGEINISSKKVVHRNILWTKRNICIDQGDLNFKGSSKLPSHILSLDTPYKYFAYFLDDEFLQIICDETNLYGTQKNPNKATSYNINDIKRFIGICEYMSVVTLPRTRCYWREDIGIENVRNSMSINKFEQIKNTLHFNDNTKMLDRGHPQFDKMFKLRPLIDHLNKKFGSIPQEDRLSIDEQICATKVRHHLRQYLPMKPNKWGFKLCFVALQVLPIILKFTQGPKITTQKEKMTSLNLGQVPM